MGGDDDGDGTLPERKLANMVEALKDEGLREIRVRTSRAGGALGVEIAIFPELLSTP